MSLRVGVIGTGVMGSEHLSLLITSLARVTVSAVYDLDAARARAAAVSAKADITVHDNPLSLIDDPEVDAILVASPDGTHEDYVLACIAARKPVLCEKPLAPTARSCLRVVEAEVECGRRLVSVGFMRRYDNAYTDLKRQLDAGALGAALVVHCIHRNRITRLPSTETLITNSAIHEFDTIRWLLGEEITSATVHRPRRSSLVQGDAYDPLLLVLETAGGVVVDVEVFANAQYGYEVQCEVVGERGSITTLSSASTLMRRGGAQSNALSSDWRDRFGGAYQSELQHWVDDIGRGAAGGADAWDGYAATAVAEATIDSLTSGDRTLIVLQPRPGLYQGTAGDINAGITVDAR